MRCHWRAGRAQRRSREALRREERAEPHCRRPHRVRSHPARRLQGSQARRVSLGAAKDQRRQDSAPRAPRRAEKGRKRGRVGPVMNDTVRAGSVASPAEVLAFWRSAGPEKWFEKNDAFDADIRRKFLATYEAAAAGFLSAWERTPEDTLALLIVLDQFPRNMFRGNPRTFAADPVARAVAGRAIARGFDQRVEPLDRQFFYLPFEHSETMTDQERCVALFSAME